MAIRLVRHPNIQDKHLASKVSFFLDFDILMFIFFWDRSFFVYNCHGLGFFLGNLVKL